LDGDLDVFFYALLAYVFVEALGADAGFDAGVFVEGAPETMRSGWREAIIRFAVPSGITNPCTVSAYTC